MSGSALSDQRDEGAASRAGIGQTRFLVSFHQLEKEQSTALRSSYYEGEAFTELQSSSKYYEYYTKWFEDYTGS